MAATKELVLDRINTIPEYVSLFKKAFPGEKEPVTYENVARAIAAFERTLMTPFRFDRFLEGDKNALSSDERKGLDLVVTKGCTGWLGLSCNSVGFEDGAICIVGIYFHSIYK